MKRKLIICSSLITIILSCFSFPIFAEETVQDSSNLHTLNDGVLLDQYFYDNYDLLPYLESDGNQYINTGVKPSSNIAFSLKFSNFVFQGGSDRKYLIACRDSNNTYGVSIVYEESNLYMYISNTLQSTRILLDPYIIHDVSILGNDGYLDGSLVISRDSQYSIDQNIYLFGQNNSGSIYYRSIFRLYSFKIYDYSLNDGKGGYIGYYYPAKAKASGTLGLYDAVSNTFITTSSTSPFTNPSDQYVENFQISSFLTNSLAWIGQIFTAIIQMPIIIVFMAIGLAGAMFRWGRRIVHF